MHERLALIGDIHANLPALAAVLDAIGDAGIPRGACVGDLVLRGRQPEECVTTLRERGWPCVRGNADAKVALREPRPPDHSGSLRAGARSWTRRRLSAESLAYLGALPHEAVVKVGRFRVALVHGDDKADGTLIDESTPDALLAEIGARLGADCLVSGHTHLPRVRHVGALLVVNPGSVGEARLGDRRPAWGWLEAAQDGLAVHLERIEKPLAHIRRKAAAG